MPTGTLQAKALLAAKSLLFATLKRAGACAVATMTLLGTATPNLVAQQAAKIRAVSIREDVESLPLPMPEPIPPGELPNALSLQDVESIALGNNPSIGRAQALVAAARGNWVQVGLPPNPAAGYLGQQLGSGGQAEQHGVLIEKEFVRGRKLELNRAMVAQEVVQAEQELAAQYQRVLTDVRIVFYETLIAERRLRLTADLVQTARQGEMTAQQLLEKGETAKVDLLQATLELENAEILHTNAGNRHAASWRTLAAVIGVPQIRPSTLQGDLETIPDHTWQPALQRLLSTSPEISAAVANIERARWKAVRARAEPIPNVSLQGVVMQDNGIGGKTDGIVQFTMPIPILNRNQGAIRQAEGEAVAAERALQQLELGLQNRLALVFERYSNALNQVNRYRTRILPAAQESLELARRGYAAGEYGYLSLLTAQRTYFQTNLNYLESLRELRTASTEIDGLLLTNSLQAGR